MNVSEFVENFFGIKLLQYQKDLIDRMDEMCNKCPIETRSICKAYGGFCDRWKRLDNRNNWLSYLLSKPEIGGKM